MTMVVSMAASRVCPSGAALATCTAPMTVSAPGRFSTTTGWPQSSFIFCAITRDRMSVGPPAGNGTTMRMVRLGYVCACAGRIDPSAAAPIPAITLRRDTVMATLPSLHAQADLLRQRRPIGVFVGDELGHAG